MSLGRLQLILGHDPLHLGQRLTLVERLHALVGVLGLLQRRLGDGVGVLQRRGVELGNRLPLAHRLAGVHKDALYRAVHDKGKGDAARLFDGTREALLSMHRLSMHLLHFYPHDLLLGSLFLLSAAIQRQKGRNSRQQSNCLHVLCFFRVFVRIQQGKNTVFFGISSVFTRKKMPKVSFLCFWPCGPLCLQEKSTRAMTVGHAVVAIICLVVQAGGKMRHADDNGDRRGDGNKHHQTTGSAHVTQKTREMGKEAEN